ncbi:DUF6470 family protein [Paenibacillus sp. GCM10023250]|uniref:DUF6470 family protein n=1 Tax=Paenibacillus sp. GCM10023250 TaxID=3252648 RepID=UPI00360A4451
MNDLRLSIRQTYAAIGIESGPAKQEMTSPRGDQQIEQPAAKMDFQSVSGRLEVDSSQAWHALGKGPNLEWSSAVYSQMKSVFLQQLAQKVEEGKRLADLANPRNAFADLARQVYYRSNLVDYQTIKPDYDNVKLSYTPGETSTRIEASPVHIRYEPRKPEIHAERGKLDIYLRQKNSIDIEVSTYDLYK